MSGLYENQKTLRRISVMKNEFLPADNVKFYFVVGYPRSDIGKGTLVAQLLSCTPDSDAIKFDGLLNTNANGRHTARGHDDFGIYEKFNPKKSFSDEHYLLGGELYREFIDEFGENENLQINPHFSHFVEYKILKMWNDIGRPKNLFIEIGGVLSDPEVEPILAPIIQRLTTNSSKNIRVILLSELAYNGEYIKTKTIQDSVKMLRDRQITPWLIVARESRELPTTTLAEKIEYERIISQKIYEHFNFRLLRVISVPFFRNLSDYTSYMRKRFLPLISNFSVDDVLIATGNKSKFADFQLYIGDDFRLTMPRAKINIPEGVVSIEDNAVAKARAYSILTGQIAIGDDTGFFIRELNGEPGVALRRWGGELPENVTQKEFWAHLQQKTAKIKDLSCYFSQCIAIVAPNGEYVIIYNKNEGFLDRKKLRLAYNGSAYPLGAAFKSVNRAKTWDEMSDEEKRAFDKDLIGKIYKSLISIIKNAK